jgi:hypothetical protein
MRVDVTENIDEQSLSIRVFSESDMVDSTLSRVIARVSSPDGSSVIQSMVFNDATRSWEMTLTPDKGEGQYEVMLNIRGVSSSGMTFKSKPETIAKRFPMERPGIIPEEPGVLTSESVVEAPSDAESPQPVPFETDANDATPEPEEVSEPINPAELEEEAPEPAAPEPTVPDEAVAAEAPDDVEDESGIAWWVYVILGIANLGLMGGLAWWWLSRKKKSSAETSVPDSDSKPTKLPEGELDIGNLDDADLESGDFDDFNSEAEEEIPVADDESHIPTSMGGDTDMGSAVAKEDFKIDEEAAESEGDDDEWGEFDLPDDENPKT